MASYGTRANLHTLFLQMADTAVRPRPNFSTFLRSDASAGGDAMTYYRRKQYLRKNRTALLQAKAGNLPDIQKPSQKKPVTLEVAGESVLPKVPLPLSQDLVTVELEEPTEEVLVYAHPIILVYVALYI